MKPNPKPETRNSKPAKPKPWWATIIEGLLARRGLSLGKLAETTRVSKPTLSRWFAAERAPQQAQAQKAVLRELKKLGLQEDAFNALIAWTFGAGGPAKTALEQLIGEGFIAKPSDGSKRLTLQEAADMHQIITAAAAAHFRFPLDARKHPVNPFEALRGPADVYLSPETRKLLDHLTRVLAFSSSMAVVTAPTGAGKSTLKRYLAGKLSAEQNFRVLEPDLLDLRGLNEATLHRLILDAAGLTMWGDPQSRGRETRRALKEMANSQRVLLVIDQAEDIPDDGMLILKRLSEWTEGWETLVHVLILGQPQIRTHFQSERNRQVAIRADVRDLPGLKAAWPFLEHRFTQAGFGKGDLERIFPADTRAALDQKASALADGAIVTPRMIENLTARALNWAAKYKLAAVTPEAVEHVQDRD